MVTGDKKKSQSITERIFRLLFEIKVNSINRMWREYNVYGS
jgi:hypothetical protein